MVTPAKTTIDQATARPTVPTNLRIIPGPFRRPVCQLLVFTPCQSARTEVFLSVVEETGASEPWEQCRSHDPGPGSCHPSLKPANLLLDISDLVCSIGYGNRIIRR